MSETVYEVSDGKISIPSDVLLGGENYSLRHNGDGEYYLAHIPRRDDDGSRSILMLEDGYTALQRFCHEVAQSMGHRPEYSLALSGLIEWSLQEERQDHAQKLVQDYGETLYRGDKNGRREGARFIRLFRDAITTLNQFGSQMSERLGGMTPERTIVLTALTHWAVEQEEAPDVVDDYALQLYSMRREERKKARAKMKGEPSDDGTSDVIVTDVLVEGEEEEDQ